MVMTCQLTKMLSVWHMLPLVSKCKSNCQDFVFSIIHRLSDYQMAEYTVASVHLGSVSSVMNLIHSVDYEHM